MRRYDGRPVARRLFNAAALLSLVLCVGAMMGLGRSLLASDQLQWIRMEEDGASHYRWYFMVLSGRGGLEVALDAEVYDLDALTGREKPPPPGWRWQYHSTGPPVYPRPAFNTRERPRLPFRFNPWLGFWFEWSRDPATVRREIIVPYWSLAVLTGALPAVWLVRTARRRLRDRRAAAGLCTACGYDLRGSAGRCPECGAIRATAPEGDLPVPSPSGRGPG